ncbi:MAG: hypothetical protein KAJ51_11995 [Thermoplasmata archaeon]|nr:hypothetical protein [Thermoplasmata archaeon]
MDENTSINKAVEQILESKPFIKDMFRIEVVNYSGLARYLIPILKNELTREKINIEAVIMAVKRYSDKVTGETSSHRVLEILSKCDLRLKGDLVDVTLNKTIENDSIALEVYKQIDLERGDIIHVYQSLTEIAILIDDKNKKLLQDAQAIHIEKNLAMVTLKTPPEMIDVGGFIYYLLGLISSEGINLIDVISTYTELNFVVREEDGAKTYNVLFSNIKNARKMMA